MAIELIFHLLEEGPPQWVSDNAWLLLKVTTTIAALYLLKLFTSGHVNRSDRKMHGKVVMITGGTSGIGAATAFELAQRGAQIILLNQAPVADHFLVEYISDLRARTGNEMIYAEQVDLSSLHSIRKFATKWIDNAPPRRLDMIILCAATITPPGKKRQETIDGIEETWMVNYLANFHLLGILSPAIKAQPFDREIRIICTTCSSYIGSPSLKEALGQDSWTPSTAYRRSKLALMVFGQAFQKHLDSYKRPDSLPMNARVIFVDPGFSRTPGMRRWLTRGSLWGLFVYVITYPLPWLFLKSPSSGAQSLLYAAMEASLGRANLGQGEGAKLVKECRKVDFARTDINDDEVAKKLWEESDKLIESAEKESALRRARQKKVDEQKAQEQKNDQEEAQKVKEIESLINTIKMGKEKESQKPKSKKKTKKADS